jgi:hypothetical protein
VTLNSSSPIHHRAFWSTLELTPPTIAVSGGVQHVSVEVKRASLQRMAEVQEVCLLARARIGGLMSLNHW